MIYIASDHAGYALKQKLVKYMIKHNLEFADLGTNSPDRVDFVDYALRVVEKVKEDSDVIGILICGTGIGMSIVANRYKGIRAALCGNKSAGHLGRAHNNANILILPGRQIGAFRAQRILKEFLNTRFLGGVYAERMDRIDA